MERKICIEFASGTGGCTGLYVNDRRITNCKVYGYIHAESLFYVDYDLLKNSCDEKGKIQFEVYRKSQDKQELFINGQPTQGNISLEEFQEHLKSIQETIEKFKHTRGRHDWSLCRRYQETVNFSEIERALK